MKALIRYEKELTPEEEQIYNSGVRDAAENLISALEMELREIRAKWDLGGPLNPNAQGFSGHCTGLSSAIGFARILTRK